MATPATPEPQAQTPDTPTPAPAPKKDVPHSVEAVSMGELRKLQSDYSRLENDSIEKGKKLSELESFLNSIKESFSKIISPSNPKKSLWEEWHDLYFPRK